MEKHILKFRLKKRLAEAMMILGMIGLMVGLIGLINDFPQILLVTLVTTALILILLGFSNFSSLKDRFKADFLDDLLSSHVSKNVYDPHHGMTEKQVYDSLLLPRNLSIKAYDMTAGAFKNIAFISSDIIINNEENNVFFGRLFMFEFNRHFQATTIIQPSAQKPFERTLKRHEALEAKLPLDYELYTSHHNQAKNLLNDAFVNALKALDDIHKKCISISLNHTTAYLAIQDMKKTFEMRMFRPINHKELLLYAQDMALIQQFIFAIHKNPKNFELE